MENPLYSKFRNKGLPFANELTTLFKDVVANAGWEGIAHDARVFDQALTNANLNFPHPPPGMYYLVDAGYPTPMGF
ncbi:hypothetical protein P8452_23146 [Trifolium repens]|nr:hypothetical protein P8452_23146 [Trifolium repens]